jgi:hypothetical protein
MSPTKFASLGGGPFWMIERLDSSESKAFVEAAGAELCLRGDDQLAEVICNFCHWSHLPQIY